VDPLEAPDDVADLSDDTLARHIEALERRRPGAPVPSTGVRPRRQPWTYRDIDRLARFRAEAARRGLAAPGAPGPGPAS